jgi:hypothetical protein
MLLVSSTKLGKVDQILLINHKGPNSGGRP